MNYILKKKPGAEIPCCITTRAQNCISETHPTTKLHECQLWWKRNSILESELTRLELSIEPRIAKFLAAQLSFTVNVGRKGIPKHMSCGVLYKSAWFAFVDSSLEF